MRSTTLNLNLTSVLLMLAASSGAALAGEQDAIDGCIDQLRKVGGPDARSGGTVLSSEFSQADTLVKLRDAGGTTCSQSLANSLGRSLGGLDARKLAADVTARRHQSVVFLRHFSKLTRLGVI